MNEPVNPSLSKPAKTASSIHDAVNQELTRDVLRATLANAIDHARIAQRTVGVLIVALARGDRLDALFGVPNVDIMRRALKRLPGALRPVDRFLQISDEKICVILPNLKTGAQAWLAAGKIQQALEAPFSFDDALTNIRPVVGIACFPDHAEDAEELVVHADIAKRIARTRDVAQHVFQRDDRRDADAYLGLEEPLREAIRTNQLEVHYQPQVDLKTGACHAVEGLLRWTLPDRGPISPPAIIRVAEANRMISSLTTWVLGTVLRHQSEWKHLGVDLEVDINLSTVTLTDADLPDVIAQAIGTWGSDPAKVTLEITESATIGDADQSMAVMKRLKQMGLRLSVDDFGTGYSSLSYVKNFPLDEIKIDKLFVQHMRQSKGDQQIVRSVIDLAHNFELSVVAEGIEDMATFKDLKKMGCDRAQGFLISAALPTPALLEWLKKKG
ncbi:MAG: GGDEF domain-containing phosphodiesterase [Betaproteobacteria bacterium]